MSKRLVASLVHLVGANCSQGATPLLDRSLLDRDGEYRKQEEEEQLGSEI